MKECDWPQVGDEVELIAVPSGLHPDSAKLFRAGMAGRVLQRHGNHTCHVDFPTGTLVMETRLLRRRYSGSDFPVFAKGDKVELIEIPSDISESARNWVRIGDVGVVCALSGDASRIEVEFPCGGKLSTFAKLFRRSLPGASVKVIPGSTVQVSSVQNISIDVLGEARTLNVSAGAIVDWHDEKSKHTPLSDTSRLMGVRMRQAIRKLVDAEKLLEFVPKDESDHAHLRYIEVSSRITNGILSIVDDIENTVSDAAF